MSTFVTCLGLFFVFCFFAPSHFSDARLLFASALELSACRLEVFVGLDHARPSRVVLRLASFFILTVFFVCFDLWTPSLCRLRQLSRGFLRVGMTCFIAAFTSVSFAVAFDHSVRDSASTVASAHRHALLLSFAGPRPLRVTGCFVLAVLFPCRLAPLPPLCSCCCICHSVRDSLY